MSRESAAGCGDDLDRRDVSSLDWLLKDADVGQSSLDEIVFRFEGAFYRSDEVNDVYAGCVLLMEWIDRCLHHEEREEVVWLCTRTHTYT